jgi:hypothetical protein
VTVLIQDVGGASALVTATATVTNHPGLHRPDGPGPQATGTVATATTGAAFAGSVATFTGSVVGGTAADYTATIDWGDGFATSGAVRPTSPSTFSVDGGHTYAVAGTYTVTISITDSLGSSSTVTTTLTVADPETFFTQDGPGRGRPGAARLPEASAGPGRGHGERGRLEDLFLAEAEVWLGRDRHGRAAAVDEVFAAP